MDSETVLEAKRTLQALQKAEQSLASLMLKFKDLPGVEDELPQEMPGQSPASSESIKSPARGNSPLTLAELGAFLDRLNEEELLFFRDELRAAALQVEATRELEADLLDAGVL